MISVHPTTGAPSFDSEQAFLDFVASEALGRATPEEAAWLRQPENLEVWRDALTDLVRKTNTEQTKRRADGQLRGDQDESARGQVREKLQDAVCNIGDIRPVFFIHGRVVGYPDYLRSGQRIGCVCGEAQ